MDERTRLPVASREGFELRDRDVMNLLDQLEKYLKYKLQGLGAKPQD